MKPTKTLMCAMAVMAMTFAASKASAIPVTTNTLPLKLTSLSGTFYLTTNYSAISDTNKAKITTVSFNLKKMMTVITNQVRIDSGTTPPTDAYVVYDADMSTLVPSNSIYLTNGTGYHYNLYNSNIVSVAIDDIATSFNFKTNNGSGSESDKCVFEFDMRGHGPDGLYYEVETYCLGSLDVSVNSVGKATMTLSGSGGGYGEYQSSDEGVAKGSFTFKGTGTPSALFFPYLFQWD